MPVDAARSAWPQRHAVRWAIAVLALAAFNLTFRIDREMVDVWDESLFATHALEMIENGRWAVTTFQGEVDYYDSKPPLNTWLIAASFQAFGVGIVALRLPAVLCAWLTVLAIQWWTRRVFGERAAVLASLVLATTYGFLYVHSGRTANADAPMTLAITLAAFAVWAARTAPWQLAWTGPLAAAATLLKGPAALGFLIPIVAVDALWPASAARWRARAAAALLFAAPVAAWTAARWRFDGTAFLGRMIGYDIVTRIGQPIDEHAGSALFYLNVLQRHQYEWLVVAAAALALAWPGLAAARRWIAGSAEARATAIVFAAWTAATIVVPSMIATKTQWYLNPFYPLFAILVALAIGHALDTLRHAGRSTAARVLATLVAAAVIVAEGKMAWRSFGQVDLGRSPQQLLIRQAPRLSGARVFAETCPYPEAFLARAAGAICVPADAAGSSGGGPGPSDYVLTRGASDPANGLQLVDRNDASALYRRSP
jgi:4-amino-4-deoxy-L-arabinose transferase-like glycosyltransferase